MSNIDEKLASIPTSPLLAERMTKKQPSCENDPKIAGCSDDTISRKALSDAFCKAFCGCYYCGVSCHEAEVIEQQPSARAEQKKGKWILDRSGAYCCSECMEPCAGYVMMQPRDKFCKMCGSRNEVTE